MKTEGKYKERGQTLVQVAMLMTVLLGFLALAIDVGWMYAGRRQMQNAADAGALAGAYEICFGIPGNAEDTARNYAVTRNGAHTADVVVADWTVTVVAKQTKDLFVADVIGLGTVEVGADAVAACGTPSAACGLWPIAFDLDRWEQLLEAPCGTPFYVWEGTNDNKELNCDVCDCDVPEEGETVGDGVDDIIEMQGRAWIDFSGLVDEEYWDDCKDIAGCSEKEIKCWVASDTGARVELPACIPGDQGTKWGAHQDVIDRALSDDPVVGIPLFDGIDTPRCSGLGNTCGAQGHVFDIVDFGCVTVLDAVNQLDLLCDEGERWKGHAIKVARTCEPCETYCGFTYGGEPPPWGMKTVSLIR
jgi:hypothetical protein